MTAVLDFYRSPGPMTGLGPHARLADVLPPEILAIRDAVQGLLLHLFWAERRGVLLTETRKAEVNLRRVERQICRLLELDPSPLDRARPLEHRLVGTCRDFSTIMAGLLRAKGIPARARCGFATYFRDDGFEDHWTCECWDAASVRWRLVDAQLDTFQAEKLKIDFDPLDVPRDRFINGSAAWRMCRSGGVDPEWDHGWGHRAGEDASVYPLMDRIARLAESPDASLDEIRSLAAADPGFSPPPKVLA